MSGSNNINIEWRRDANDALSVLIFPMWVNSAWDLRCGKKIFGKPTTLEYPVKNLKVEDFKVMDLPSGITRIKLNISTGDYMYGCVSK